MIDLDALAVRYNDELDDDGLALIAEVRRLRATEPGLNTLLAVAEAVRDACDTASTWGNGRIAALDIAAIVARVIEEQKP